MAKMLAFSYEQHAVSRHILKLYHFSNEDVFLLSNEKLLKYIFT